MPDEELETPDEEMQCPMKNQNSLLYLPEGKFCFVNSVPPSVKKNWSRALHIFTISMIRVFGTE
jgi:hypothetical protein